MISTSYYIHELRNNIFNKNDFIFVDGFDGQVDIKDTCLIFNLNFYITGDFRLPPNCLMYDFVTPFGKVSNIPYNEDRLKPLSDHVQWPEMSKCFSSKFILDIGEIDYFKQGVFEEEINFQLFFDVNDKVYSDAEIAVSVDDNDRFIGEVVGAQATGSFVYSNQYEAINDTGSFMEVNQYYLSSYEEFKTQGSLISYEYNDQLKERNKPMVKFLTLKSQKNFTVCDYQIRVSYWFGDDKKEVIFKNKRGLSCAKECDISIQDFTYFDEERKQITVQNKGIFGFYSPFETHGTIECVVRVKEDNENKKIIFSRTFNYSDDDEITTLNVGVQNVFINDIKNFREVVF